MPKIPISCFIIAKNEADRIARAIRSVRGWVDEVIVIDSESSDGTDRVALAEGCRVIVQPWLGFGGQKRFAEELCRNDWVLNLDADEVVTPHLRREIIALFRDKLPLYLAYRMPQKLVYPNVAKPRPLARDHQYIRLYNRRVVRFRNSPVHDTVVSDWHPVGELKGAMHHYSMRSFEDMKMKLDQRCWLWVKHAGSRSNATLIPRLITEIPFNFIKYYIGRRHITGGMTGLKFASIMTWYRFLRVYRLWAAKRSHHRQSDDGGANDGQVVDDPMISARYGFRRGARGGGGSWI